MYYRISLVLCVVLLLVGLPHHSSALTGEDRIASISKAEDVLVQLLPLDIQEVVETLRSHDADIQACDFTDGVVFYSSVEIRDGTNITGFIPQEFSYRTTSDGRFRLFGNYTLEDANNVQTYTVNVFVSKGPLPLNHLAIQDWASQYASCPIPHKYVSHASYGGKAFPALEIQYLKKVAAYLARKESLPGEFRMESGTPVYHEDFYGELFDISMAYPMLDAMRKVYHTIKDPKGFIAPSLSYQLFKRIEALELKKFLIANKIPVPSLVHQYAAQGALMVREFRSFVTADQIHEAHSALIRHEPDAPKKSRLPTPWDLYRLP